MSSIQPSPTLYDNTQPTEDRDPRLGVVFILLSCLVQGTQYVFEEKVMAVDGLPPMWLIGLEVRTQGCMGSEWVNMRVKHPHHPNRHHRGCGAWR